MAEGGGAVALAALLSPEIDLETLDRRAGPLVVVLSGGNIAAETLAEVLSGDEAPPDA